MKVIEAQSLAKSYRVSRQTPGFWGALRGLFKTRYVAKDAVKNVSFQVAEGDIVGIVGPNGAGKSTLIKMLVGILRPDAGSLKVHGYEPFKDRRAYVREIGVVFGQRTNLLWDLAVVESFELHRQIYTLSRTDYEEHLQELSDTFGLQELWHQPVRTLSLGQRVRATIALALLPRPRILFLDEPTVGLDVLAVDRLVRILKAVNRRQQITILVTSHDLGLIENLCRSMILFDRGSILFDGTVAAAMNKYGSYKKLKIVFGTDEVPVEAAGLLPAALKVQETLGNQLSLIFNASEMGYQEVLALVQSFSRDFQVAEFYLEKPSLNEVIFHVFS